MPTLSLLISLIATYSQWLAKKIEEEQKADAYLDLAVLLPAQLDLSKLALSNGVAQNEVAKLCVSFVVSVAVIVSTPTTSSLLMIAG